MSAMVLPRFIVTIITLYFSQCTGQLTLGPAEVREGEALVLTCKSTEPGGTYRFYSSNQGSKETYGIGTGSLRICRSEPLQGYILECDFDNWIFNLTISLPVHNQVIFCERNMGRGQLMSINVTIFVQVPVKRITLSTPRKIDVVSGNIFTFTCKTFGSRPVADILWHFNSTTFSWNNSVVSHNDKKFDVTSTLTLTFTRKDQGKVVYCSSNIVGELPLQSTKTFLNVLFEDSGRYSCTISNSAGSSSGFINVNVQKKPFPPPVIQVVCKTNFAFISLTSSFLGIEGKQTLQYSKIDDVYENATVEVLNKTQPEINIYKVLNLSPGTEYTFRILVSNVYGITSSKRHKCSTDIDAQTERMKNCEMESIIGGTLGGIVFIIILLVGVTALYKSRKQRIDKGKSVTTNRKQDVSYVDQVLPSSDHSYQGFSTSISKETMNTNTYEKMEECHEREKGSEYMELTHPCKREEDEMSKTVDTGGMYSDMK
ncbi:cell adhesion molecule 2-like [Saccostrea echinata]|uniref:cell adhesion molecule 2-like n=1 Tax=Saccostrea echinata TaxID=191078 RepID=UPI002A804E6B|nr:cell adhesion molecule 2-like [Saccostrea echinata]